MVHNIMVSGNPWLLFRVRYYILCSYSVLTSAYDSRKRYRLRPRSPLASASPGDVPGVSILRPLKGLDPNLYENLESTFTQEYPNFEIFFAVADQHDQALSVVRDLISKYPDVDAYIVTGVSYFCLPRFIPILS
jgi:ceramide glucosyltransferase